MKRLFAIVLAIVAIAVVPVAAEDSPFSITAGGGLTWSQRFDMGFIIADVLLGLRGGIWGDAMFSLNDVVALGGELGMYYMSWEGSDGGKVFLGDFPVQAKASFALGGLRLDALGGVLFTMDIGGRIVFGTNALAGARLSLGSIYAEADYLYHLGATHESERTAYPRFALGYSKRLLN